MKHSKPLAERLTRRGKTVVITAATAVAVGGSVAAVEGGSDAAGKPNPIVTCDIATVAPGQTLWDIQDKTGISYEKLDARHPNARFNEANPVDELQPGDIVSTRLGAAACADIHGKPEPVVE